MMIVNDDVIQNIIQIVIQRHPTSSKTLSKCHPKRHSATSKISSKLASVILESRMCDRYQGHMFSYIMTNGFDHPAKDHLISCIDHLAMGIHVYGSSHDQIGNKWYINAASRTYCIYHS